MSLYDDLDVKPGTAPSTLSGTGWALASMQKALMQRRQAPSQRAGGAQPAPPATLPPVVNLKAKREVPKPSLAGPGGEYRFNQRTGTMERASTKGVNDPTLAVSLDDEYNPSYPNEYDEVVTMVRAKRKMQELAEQEQRQQQQLLQPKKPAPAPASGHDSDGSFEGSPSRRRSGSESEQSDHEEEEEKRRMGRGAYIAPPSSLIEQDSKQPEPRPADAAGGPFPIGAQLQVAAAKPSLAAKHNVSTAAAKMMAKMGYRDGQGLGREGQGMASALSVEKTSKRGGKIVSELDRYKNPTTVILLTNMVGPGEVDDELEDEIKDECNKYGPVVMVMIYELPGAGVPPEEAVRIFVEFERLDSAIKAMNELNGRFFGGRTVACRFYDAEKFKDLELDSSPLPLELNE